MNQNIAFLFQKNAQVFATIPALVDDGGRRSLSYDELYRMSTSVAGKLRAIGCIKGDRAAICMGRQAEYIASYLGIMMAGCCAVPLIPDYPQERIDYIVEHCQAKIILTESFFQDLEKYEPLFDPSGDTDPALLIYTSGSTGKPKGVLHSNADVYRGAERHRTLYSEIQPLHFAASGQLSFVVVIAEYFAVLAMGGTTYILSENARKSNREIISAIREQGLTVAFLAPQMLRNIRNWSCPSLQVVLAGSERLSNVAPAEGIRLINVWGMSETCAMISSFPVDRAYENTPIGKAAAPLEVLICDENGQEVPRGEKGELCVRAQMDTCYYKNPEETRKKMMPLPDGRTLFHTGDMGFVNEQGNLVFLNRMDWVVKINGQRVDSMEIETQLCGIAGVAQAVVKSFEDSNHQTYLAAYYVSEAGLDELYLRKALGNQLPDYMIPRFFVPLESLPVNVNGKVDRFALLPPDINLYKTAYAAPSDPTEKAICEAFETVLQCGRVGAEDDFFALGGDSIKSLLLADAVPELKLSARDVILGKTPRGIAALCQANRAETVSHQEQIPETTPLLEAQLGVYLECLANPKSVMYNIPALCRLPENADTERFASAVRKAAALHPVLKVTVRNVNGVPSMVYQPQEIVIYETSVQDIDSYARDFIRPFDLAKGPLYRFELCRDEKGAAFLMDVHHLVFDGTSVEVFLSQIAKAYDGQPLMEEQLTAFDLSAAESCLRDQQSYKNAQAFFARQLDGVDYDSLFISDRIAEDIPRGAEKVLARSEAYDVWPQDILHFTKTNHITENTLFLGAFAYAEALFRGKEQSCFCTANNGRHDARLSESVGMFVKTLPFVTSFTASQPASEYLRDTQNRFFETMENDCISFGDLVRDYGVNTDLVFIYQSELFRDVELGGGKMKVEMLETPDVQSPMEVMLFKEEGGYELSIQYRRELYSEELMRSFASLYWNVVKGMLSGGTLGDIALVDADAERLLNGFNATEAPYRKEQTVIDLFRETAKRVPDSTCVVYRDHHYTYRQMDELTDRLAAALIRLGVGKEKSVGILIPRCEYMPIAALGVLKAGGGYLPMDPSYPAERLNLMLTDSDAVVLITTPELSGLISPDYHGPRVMTDEIPSLPALSPSDLPLPCPAPEDLFITLYTSGSTGTPKGVVYAHSNAMVTAEWVAKYARMDESARVTAYASFGFDANVFDTYAPFLVGAQLHIIPEELRMDYGKLTDYYTRNGITHSVMTTQVGRQFALAGKLPTVKVLSVAGEKLTPLDPPEGMDFYNLYGPTEGSVVSTAFLMEKRYKDVPIGKPVDNLKAYVVDRQGRLLPVGAVGELWIAGPHVTRGYRNRPEKTAEAYGVNPFTRQEGYERVYRTGDKVRFLPDGNLQFIGRGDAQVKVRGFRVELTEIEEIVRRFPGIKDATVAAFDDPAGGKFIAAYVVSPEPVDTKELASFILKEKPPYMVPAVVMQLEKIPLNQNQKVNRRALPVPQRDAGPVTLPQNELQQKIYELAADAMGHKAFGIDTDLFEAGLTSIASLRLNILLSDAFNIPVSIEQLHQNSTVLQLEALISSAAPAETFEMQEDYPLSGAQEGVFVDSTANPGSTVYNIPMLLHLSKQVDLNRLREAVIQAVNAHPYLKARLILNEEGKIRVQRRDDAPVEMSIQKVQELPAKDELVRAFELMDNELYRLSLYETEQGNFLFMDFHHLIFDGASSSILLRDIDLSYGGGALSAESFTGYEAALLDEKQRTESYDKAKAYWNQLLKSSEGCTLPQKDAEDPNGGAGNIRFTGRADMASVRAYCEKNGFTFNAYFNSVFALVLSRFANVPTATYATIYNGRNDSRLHDTVTMLVRTFFVNTLVKDDMPLNDFVRETQNQLVSSMANGACTLSELSRDYGLKTDVIFVYQGEAAALNTLCGEEAELVSLNSETAKAPISFCVYVEGDHFTYTIEYRKELYSEAVCRSLLQCFDQAADRFAKAATLHEVELLGEDAEGLYRTLNDNDVPLKPIYLHQLVEDYAVKAPDRVALIAAGQRLPYSELNKQANRAAHRLMELGVHKDSIIGLVMDRTKEVFITELAIMKAGGAFLPMVPSYPDERIEYCLTDAESPMVITTRDIYEGKQALFSADHPYQTLLIEELLQDGNTENPNLSVDPSQLAYCIYTSGSTGKPKGVMLEQHSFSGFLQTDWIGFDFYSKPDETATSLANSSISFDMSVEEMYLPLSKGRTVCMSTEEEIHNPLQMRDLMLQNNVRFMVCTPSYMNNIAGIPEFAPVIARLQTVVMGAEAFPPALFDKLRAMAPELQILNGYGPTEASICCSRKELLRAGGITIGRPVGNVKLYVLDRSLHIQPPYALGELAICGNCVARGYIKLPEKTSAAFIEVLSLRGYRSGDRVYLNKEAEIVFGGRIDNQVKLRGFRVELDEIENVICEYEGVKQSKVVMRNNGTEDYLVGFFTAEKTVDTEDLAAHLRSRLTYYMVPAALMQLERMPLTPNGKIDKKALPEVQQKARKNSRKAPKKSLEQKLCEIFAKVLDMGEVFADDHFFELGGTSLSASKVTMMLMSEGINVKYGDIFDHPTPEALAEFIQQRDTETVPAQTASAADTIGTSYPALQKNTLKYAPEVKREALGNVLLTGATGFLGSHVLKELLSIEKGRVWCLVRGRNGLSPEEYLRAIMVYYFGEEPNEEQWKRISIIEGDVTDKKLYDRLKELPLDTVINCAACVKHFSDDDILDRINVHGVENLIECCLTIGLELVQISTTSVPGVHTAETYEKQIEMHENELFVINDMQNKYCISKYQAELRVLRAIEQGMRGKIIRVGNLMGRQSDGEFQINMQSNIFMSGIRGFAAMGKCPISHMTDRMCFSPVDCTARAVVLLAGTNDQFTAFNCSNRYGFDEMKIIDACNRNGIVIQPVEDSDYYEEFHRKLGDDQFNSRLNGLAAYDVPDVHSVQVSTLFTAGILYRIGFSWPLVDDTYLDMVISSIKTLDYFNMDESENP